MWQMQRRRRFMADKRNSKPRKPREWEWRIIAFGVLVDTPGLADLGIEDLAQEIGCDPGTLYRDARFLERWKRLREWRKEERFRRHKTTEC
jgi:hypothetical protein